MTFNITPKRLAALRLIKDTPGIYVGAVAQQLLAGDRRGTRGLWSQQATRMGAGYCKALERERLISINTFVDCGYGRCTITAKGHSVIDNRDTLDAAIARSVE